MFIYSFKTPGTLIQHIVLQKTYITFYVTKPDEHNTPEFTHLARSLKLKVISGDDPEHGSLHNENNEVLPFLKAGGMPHCHMKFKQFSSKNLKNFCAILKQHQKDTAARIQEKQKLIASISQGRMSDHIQTIIEHFDTKTPFIPEAEITTMLNEYENYLKIPSLLNCVEDISDYMAHLAGRLNQMLFERMGDDDLITATEKSLEKHYVNISMLRTTLLKLHYEQDPTQKQTLKEQAAHLYAEFTNGPFVTEATDYNIGKFSTLLANYDTVKRKLIEECQRYLEHLSEKKEKCETDMIKAKYDMLTQLKTDLEKTLDAETAIRVFAAAFYDPSTRKPISLLNQHTDSYEKRCLIGILVLLTGIIPGLVVLTYNSYFSAKHSFAFWKSYGQEFNERIETYVLPPPICNNP